MYARGKLREKSAAFRLACERLAFLLRPGQAHGVVPYDQRRILRQRTALVVKCELHVRLAEDGQLDAEQHAHVLRERPRGVDECVGCNGPGALAARQLHAAHAPAAGVDALHPRPQQPCAAFTGLVQHVHAELLRAQPATAARVHDGTGCVTEVREMAANE